MSFLYRNTAPTVLKSDLSHYTYLRHFVGIGEDRSGVVSVEVESE